MYISMTSISSNLKNQLDKTITKSNVDVVIQEKGSSTPVSSRIEEETIKSIEKLDRTKSVSSLIVGSIKTKGIPYLYLFGVSSKDANLALAKWLESAIIDGNLFHSGEKEIILGRLVAKRLKKKVGETIILGSAQKYVVSGIYWVGQGILDGGAIVDISSSQDLLKRKGYVNLAVIEAQNKQEIASLIRDISNTFPNLNAIPANSLSGQIRAITMIDSFIMAVSVTALLLSGLLILNTLLMAVSERTREIGVLMAIGWSRFMVIRLIVTEALILGIIGGLVGFIASFPTLYLIKFLPAIGTGWIPVVPTISQLFTSVGLSCGIATISSLYPAFFATRLLPANALRYE
ncbi:MAG: FtsX-like permease family protein [Planctomycetia bacterium]|nr:FtsX-like permease family protein [Planctomycetia bacterium]